MVQISRRHSFDNKLIRPHIYSQEGSMTARTPKELFVMLLSDVRQGTEKAVKITGRIQEIFMEDFRKELAEIQSPVARRLFILAKLNHLTHFRIGEYVALISAADVAGHYGVGILLEACLADRLAFVERT